MKNDRQSMILEIISQENIETQEQLLSRLQERGITSTQPPFPGTSSRCT